MLTTELILSRALDHDEHEEDKTRSRGVSRSVISITTYKYPKTGFRTTVKRALNQPAMIAEREKNAKRIAELRQQLIEGETPFLCDRCFSTTC